MPGEKESYKSLGISKADTIKQTKLKETIFQLAKSEWIKKQKTKTKQNKTKQKKEEKVIVSNRHFFRCYNHVQAEKCPGPVLNPVSKVIFSKWPLLPNPHLKNEEISFFL